MAGMTKDQLTEHIKSVIAPMLAETVGKDVAEMVRQRVDELAKAASPGFSAGLFGQSPSAAHAGAVEAKYGFGTYVRALGAAMLAGHKNDRKVAARFARQWGHEAVAQKLEQSVEKAMSSADPLAGGFLVPQEFSSDVIELLRATGTIRSLNPMTVPMANGSIKIPRITTGTTGTYIGENSNITASSVATGQLDLAWKKLAVLVPISNDLIRYSSPKADTIVRDDCVRGLATREDYAFLRDNGMSGKPKGLKYWINGSNKFNANGTVNLANVTEDLGRAMQKLMDANINLVVGQAGTGALTVNPGWVFSPRTWQYLFTVQTGLGTHAFQGEMKSGTLLGFPFRVTSQVPSTMSSSVLDTGGTYSEIYFGAFAHAVIGEAEGIMVDVSDTAAYHDGTGVVAAFSQDQSVVRVMAEHDFALRHDTAFALIEQVSWGV